MKLILTIFSVILFCSSFLICKSIYPLAFEDNEQAIKFTDLRYALYAIFGIMCYIIAELKYDKYPKITKFVLDIGIGFCVSDIIDRFIFNIYTFQKEDIIMIFITISIATYYYFKKEPIELNKSGT